MPGQAIEEALVRIIADTESFEENVRDGVQSAMRSARTLALRAAKDVESSWGASGRNIADALLPFRTQVKGAMASADQLAVTLDQLRNDFRQLGPDGVRAMERIEQAIKDLDAAITGGPRSALRALGEEADRFATNYRAALGRAAVAGEEQLEESFRDITRTGEREFEILSASIKASIRELGDVPGLERLEAKFESLTTNLEVDFAVAVANTEAELREMAARGELTAETLDDAITRLAVRFDEQLGGAVKEVEDDLRRLSGDERVFAEMAENIAKAERETRELQEALFHLGATDHDQQVDDFVELQKHIAKAERETEELQAALLELERRSHEELANDFRQAQVAIEGAGDEVDELTNDLRQATVASHQLGESAQRAGRKGASGFGHMVAMANRLRFVALDARFLLTGVGVFAAAQFARMGVEATSQIEQIRLSFQVLARSIEGVSTDPFNAFTDAADAALASTLEFARETPYAVEEVADAVRKLSAFLPSFNIVPPDQIDTLNERLEVSQALFKDIGGALAVLGQQEALPRLVKALGDVAARGKLTGEEMRQFANALPGIEIRTAIITGIFDPAVQASDSITHLRNEFTKLGADAEQAPQEALNAFTEFQRQGLITTDAVLQGLRASFRNLAGDDALEKFTLTIAGSLEKIRESVNIGLYRGMENLGEVMTHSLLPAMEDVEDASQRFGEGFSNLAEASIPLLLDGFEELTSAAADVFDALAEFAIDNRALIERGMESLTETGVLLADIMLTILDATAPLVPAFLDLIVLGLEPLADITEAVAPLIREVAEFIDLIPTPALLAAAALGQLNRVLATGASGGFLAANTALQRLHITIGTLLSRAGLALLVVGVAEVATAFGDGQKAAAEFAETLEDEYGDGLEGTQNSLTQLRDRLAEVNDEYERSNSFDFGDLAKQLVINRIPGAGNPVDDLRRGIADLSRAGDIDETKRQIAALNDELVHMTWRTIPIARTQLVALGEGMDDFQLRALLTDDVVAQIADHLGVDLSGSVAEVGQAFRDAVPGAGGLAAILREIGVELPDIDFSGPIGEADDLANAFDTAATALQDLIDKQRAATDPVFAVIDAQRGLTDALTEYQDALSTPVGEEGFEDAAEKRRAEEDALRGAIDAAREYIASTGELARAVQEDGASAEEFRTQIELITSIMGEATPAAREFLEEGLQKIIEEFPEVAAAAGLAVDGTQLIVDEFVAAEQEVARTVPKWRGDWKDLAVAAEQELQKVRFEEFVGRARDAFDQLPEILDSPLARLASTILSGNAGLFTNFFEFGRQLVNRIQEGIDSSTLSTPRYGYDNALPSSPSAPSPSAPSPSFSGSGTGGRTASSAGLTVHQTITTSDPLRAGTTAVRAFDDERFLRGI